MGRRRREEDRVYIGEKWGRRELRAGKMDGGLPELPEAFRTGWQGKGAAIQLSFEFVDPHLLLSSPTTVLDFLFFIF